MRSSQILENALRLLNGGKNWIKGPLAFDKEGKPLNSPFLESAVSFCAIGALVHAAKRSEYGILFRLIHEAMQEIPKTADRTSFAAFNEDPETTFEDIKAVYEKAIEIAQKRGD